MSSWFDLLAFTLIFAAFVGAIIGVRFVANQISSTMAATKESLKDRGLIVSDKGVSVRTSSRYSREDYVDATQRGFIKAMNAASFNKAGASSPSLSSDKEKEKRGSLSRIVPPSRSRDASSTSVNTIGDTSGSASASASGNGSGNGGKKKRLGLLRRGSES
ncbi:hypothetical protein A7U60_g3200 [Sanghuangporus baumii]|uniref:Uncharacterized protein n=1 Tax=Sanghuangporus baumii TaxID=108892 RepID=A0A9Q5I1M3_SANBA|nr:hypothetical protein A7U60_g3200 [Sanghuangporus baumii]